MATELTHIMTDELLNTPLYHHLCASVQKWFETDRGHLMIYQVFKLGNGKSYSVNQACIGNKMRNADFSVSIYTDEKVCARYVMHLSLKYNDKIGIDILDFSSNESIDLGHSVLNVINKLHNDAADATIVYSSLEDKISIHRTLYFYPGAIPPEDEIHRLVDEFFFSDSVKKIATIMEHHAWKDPLPYLYKELK